MSDDASKDASGRVSRAWMSVVGYACCQGFLFASLYLDATVPLAFGSLLLPCVDLAAICLCACVAFCVIRVASPDVRRRFFSSRWLMALAFVPALGCVARAFVGDGVLGVIVEGVSVGFCAAVLLCAWGELMGRVAIERSVPQVFIGSALGAAVGFVFGVAPINGVFLLVALLPLASTSLFRELYVPTSAEDTHGTASVQKAAGDRGDGQAPSETDRSEVGEAANAKDLADGEGRAHAPAARTRMMAQAREFSTRILFGTATFGVAAGLVEAFASSSVTAASPPAALVLLLFVLYCLAALQLFGGKPLLNVRAILPSRADDARPADGGPLDGAYRLAVLLMMAGFLLMPTLGDYALWAEHVTLAGYLGISTVLLSLFLIMGHISGRSTVLSFALGFAVLFAGEAAGLLVGGVVAACLDPDIRVLMLAVAGVAVLYGYLFLFTERDMRALSIVVEETDRFEEACERIARTAKLSKRESEILPLALRGRTSERMASELFITKNTVDTHLRRIYAKCGVHNRQELIDLGEKAERELREASRAMGGAMPARRASGDAQQDAKGDL